MIISPAFVFGFLLATFYGALAHLILGGRGRRLILFLLASWLGFALGEGLGDVLGITALSIGPTDVLAASLGSLIALLAVSILTGRTRQGPLP